jgi:hypothetical protein
LWLPAPHLLATGLKQAQTQTQHGALRTFNTPNTYYNNFNIAQLTAHNTRVNHCNRSADSSGFFRTLCSKILEAHCRSVCAAALYLRFDDARSVPHVQGCLTDQEAEARTGSDASQNTICVSKKQLPATHTFRLHALRWPIATPQAHFSSRISRFSCCCISFASFFHASTSQSFYSNTWLVQLDLKSASRLSTLLTRTLHT